VLDKPDASLHEDGYVVLTGVNFYMGTLPDNDYMYDQALRIDGVPPLLQRIKGNPIFNNGQSDERYQVPIRGHVEGDTAAADKAVMDEIYRDHVSNELVIKFIRFLTGEMPKHKIEQVSMLASGNCGIQGPHRDFPAFNVPDADVPCGALLALLKGTGLWIWPKSIRCLEGSIAPVFVSMNPGDILIFRGDLVHAGGSYESMNWRLHAYVDHDSVARDLGASYPLQDYELSYIKSVSR
jgi:hypothetical protein